MNSKLNSDFLNGPMEILEILEFPHPLLKQTSTPFTEEEVRAADFLPKVKSMFNTMYRSRGIGLAAPQVGWLKRLMVIDINWNHQEQAFLSGSEPDEDGKPMLDYQKMHNNQVPIQTLIKTGELQIFINPEIIAVDGQMTYSEGCLSVPGANADVIRAKELTLRYRDLDFKVVEQTFSEVNAVCIQHEIDHLDGKLFIDRISTIKRERITKKLQKARKEKAL